MRLKRILTYALLGAAGLALAAGAFLVGRDLQHYSGPAESTLASTGLYADIATGALADGVQPFEPQHELWSDGARKRRFILIPEGAQIDTSNPDRWNFPIGTRLWKEFERDGIVVETRMLLKTGHGPADWDMAVYLWREDRSDADKIAFSQRNAGGTAHDVPGPRLCLECHGRADQSRPLGFTLVQLPWRADGLLSVTQLIAEDRLSHPPSTPPEIPGDELTQSALGYLHANCGSCHYAGTSVVPRSVGLRLDLSAADGGDPGATNAYRTAINRTPELPGLGAEWLIAPGRPQHSFVWRRMQVRDGGGWQMPPLASEEIDARGAELIRRWIEGMDDAAPDEAPAGRSR